MVRWVNRNLHMLVKKASSHTVAKVALDVRSRMIQTIASFVRVSFYAKLFLLLVLVETFAAFTYSILLISNAGKRGKSVEGCVDPDVDECFDTRNALSFAVPLNFFTLCLVWLLFNAITHENSVQLPIAVILHTVMTSTLFYENTTLLTNWCRWTRKVPSACNHLYSRVRVRSSTMAHALSQIWGASVNALGDLQAPRE